MMRWEILSPCSPKEGMHFSSDVRFTEQSPNMLSAGTVQVKPNTDKKGAVNSPVGQGRFQ